MDLKQSYLPVPSSNRSGPVVLVSRPIAFTFPLSYAYLAGYLRQQGEDVRVLFKPYKVEDRTTLVSRIIALNPVLVGFGNLYPELKEIREIIMMLDAAGRKFPVVVGGQMVSPTPEFSVKITGADFGVIGEGEIILHNLVTSLRAGTDPGQVKGLAVRIGEEVTLSGPGEYIDDLTCLPPVPYDLFPEDDWVPIGRWYTDNCPQPHWRWHDRVVNVHGGRGCPYSCNFCYHHSKPRYRPISVMMAEARASMEKFNANVLYFSDDLVLATPTRVRQLIEELRKLPRKISYSISTRIDILSRMDDSLLAELQDTGCRIMGLGIESGSDRILKVMGKKCTAEMILSNIERLKRYNILPTGAVMVGQFSETIEDAEATIRLVKESIRINPNIQYGFSITTPFPGSQLYNYIFENKLLKDDQEFYDRYFSPSRRADWNQVVNLSAMSEEQVFQMFQKMIMACLQQRKQSQPWLVPRTEFLNAGFGRLYLVLSRFVFPVLKRFRGGRLLIIVYKRIHEFVQVHLERIRLFAAGVK